MDRHPKDTRSLLSNLLKTELQGCPGNPYQQEASQWYTWKWCLFSQEHSGIISCMLNDLGPWKQQHTAALGFLTGACWPPAARKEPPRSWLCLASLWLQWGEGRWGPGSMPSVLVTHTWRPLGNVGHTVCFFTQTIYPGRNFFGPKNYGGGI